MLINEMTQALIDFGIRYPEFKVMLTGANNSEGKLTIDHPELKNIINIFVENQRSPGSRGNNSGVVQDPSQARRIRITVNLEGEKVAAVNKHSYIIVETDSIWDKERYKSRLRELVKTLTEVVAVKNQLLFDQRIDTDMVDSIRKKRIEEAPARLEIFNRIKESLKDFTTVKIVNEKPGFNMGLELPNGVKVALGINSKSAEVSYVDVPINLSSDESKANLTKLLEGLAKL
jgi:hypothetical protein